MFVKQNLQVFTEANNVSNDQTIHTDTCSIKDKNPLEFKIKMTFFDKDYLNIKNKQEFFKKQFVDQMFADEENIKIFDFFYQIEEHNQYNVFGKTKSSNHGILFVCPYCKRVRIKTESDSSDIIHKSNCPNQFKAKEIQVRVKSSSQFFGRKAIKLTLEKPYYIETRKVDINEIPIEITPSNRYKCGICGEEKDVSSINYDRKTQKLLIFREMNHATDV